MKVLLANMERRAVQRAHITAMIPKFQRNMVLLSVFIPTSEVIYVMLKFPLPTSFLMWVAVIIPALLSVGYLVWYSYRWRE